MKNVTVFILFLLIVVFSSCKTKDKAQSSTNDADSLLVSIYKYPCFGRCPYYEAKIYASGYAATFNKKEIEELLNEAKRIGYMNMADSFYNPGLADFPAVITSIKLNDKRKTIYNCLPDAPESLKMFQQKIDAFFINENINWHLLKANQEE
jgi:hypothetical protein